MATNADIAHRYTEHGLRLIRVANGLAASANGELRAMAQRLRRVLRGYDPDGSRADIAELLREARELIDTTFAAIAFGQRNALTELVDMEATFALKATGLNTRLSETATQRVASNLLIHGSSVDAHWGRQRDNLLWNVNSAVRAAYASSVPPKTLVATLIGEGRAGMERGGTMEQVFRNSSAVVDSSVQSATNAARIASFKADDSGVNALQWFGILDTKICPNCGIRAGKLYTLDYKPIGHDVVIVGPPPLHPFCRCILLPMKFPKGPPADGGMKANSFENWLKKQPKEAQEDLLGVGRVELWQKGVIPLNSLVGQDGLVMSLTKLKEIVAAR